MSTKLNLAIKPKGRGDKIVPMSIGIKQSNLDDLHSYIQAFKDVYDEEISAREIVNDVLAAFFNREKAFQDWKVLQGTRANEKQGGPARKVTDIAETKASTKPGAPAPASAIP